MELTYLLRDRIEGRNVEFSLVPRKARFPSPPCTGFIFVQFAVVKGIAVFNHLTQILTKTRQPTGIRTTFSPARFSTATMGQPLL